MDSQTAAACLDYSAVVSGPPGLGLGVKGPGLPFEPFISLRELIGMSFSTRIYGITQTQM